MIDYIILLHGLLILFELIKIRKVTLTIAKDPNKTRQQEYKIACIGLTTYTAFIIWALVYVIFFNT